PNDGIDAVKTADENVEGTRDQSVMSGTENNSMKNDKMRPKVRKHYDDKDPRPIIGVLNHIQKIGFYKHLHSDHMIGCARL
ncbi:2716_t:CDS:2, partial [Gigaspora rosea]